MLWKSGHFRTRRLPAQSIRWVTGKNAPPVRRLLPQQPRNRICVNRARRTAQIQRPVGRLRFPDRRERPHLELKRPRALPTRAIQTGWATPRRPPKWENQLKTRETPRAPLGIRTRIND